MNRLVGVLLGLSIWAAAIPAAGQSGAASPLSLDDALNLARANNPNYLATVNDARVADWDVRSAYGSLLPSASATGGISWQGAGEQQFGSLTAEQLGFADQPSFYFSSYGLQLSYSLSGQTILAPGQAGADRNATRAQIRSTEAALDLSVTQLYLDVLRQTEGVRLTEQELERSQLNLRLAEQQQTVGVGTPIDVRQAEVSVGRSEVGVLQAEAALYSAKLRLLQAMGVDLDQEPQLVTEFELAQPTWTEEGLYQLALDQNPDLSALRANERSADYSVRIANSQYYPSASFSARWSGFTREASSVDFQIQQARASVAAQQARCEADNDLFSRLADPLPPSDCSLIQFTDEAEARIRSDNDQFPFNFEGNPPTVGLTVSLPIFQGFSRQRQVEVAKAQREDLRYRIREQELALRADIGSQLVTVQAAYQSALIEERNQVLAQEQLRLAQERYRLGLDDFIQLVEAETVMAQADRERIAAIFAYHDALAQLEATVGGTLRN